MTILRDERRTTTADPSTTADAARQGERGGRLLELAVVDLALIDRLRLTLSPGLNVLTGETGAGKSLLIDALGLALGARADSSLVRHGADAARVEALFDGSPEPRIAVREVSVAGRSIARLDDETVTAARLADTIGPLVEIHGQHEQQRLLDDRRQRDLLDAFGGHDDERASVAAAVTRWRSNREALRELAIDPRELVRRLDLLEHEAAEIEAARLRDGEAQGIVSRLAMAQHGETLARGGAELHDVLAGDRGGVRDVLARAERDARGLARIDARWTPLADRLAGIAAEVEDAAAEIRALGETVEHDPAELVRLDERLAEIQRLIRRYGDGEAAVIAHGERAAAEIDRLRGLEDERARREAEDARLLADVATLAANLSGKRHEAAERLAQLVSAVLTELGFPPDAFDVEVGRRSATRDEPAVEIDGDALAFDGSGVDDVVFRFRPNPGEPARPLGRIASGGELSRVALAIKEVLAAADDTPTLVFDEIDTGIGGRTAEPIGRSLWLLARRHQVLCVTHLPQIAAYADAHFRIAKGQRDGRTVTDVNRLDRAEQLAELGSMIGGPAGGSGAEASARELLDRAEAWRVDHGET
ncbi:MAG: DNA repair protein RecN [Chloroflexota bacterium]